ncbi:3-methyladenine DNA glycosylase [Gulosibacter chungangensis]|uniref:3-methyladenine DNA glycosylase n=1 Tax=Gulosibacter chungangensis TaxID=979746 RepID=A0A7J5BCF3_9MICO|nr:3-methyladenine DNA glycosylase [Gulosibacter chungangensis]KAB1643887.1 3-methyladenine DNA glycosylase [Gulosibacter chungangensis]
MSDAVSIPAPPIAPSNSPASPEQLQRTDWQDLQQQHELRADALTHTYREYRAAGRKHAIDDFLFTYYSYKPAVLRRWHPGIDRSLVEAASWQDKRWYRADASGNVSVDAAAYLSEKTELVRSIEELSEAVLERPARFGCFGLHEWAMVYRQDEHRHPVPLRLGQRGTDAVVESHQISCSHYDAFRFFTPEARPRNALQPTRQTQCALDQAGCLHANMDLYKWCIKLGPLVPGELLLDAFELAREIRWVDMQASPYDVSDYAVPAIAIETPEGKAEYVRLQREFAARGQVIRTRMLDVIRAARQVAAISS